MLKKIIFRGEPVEYEMKGSGVPVMLVHGFTEDRRIWESLVSGIGEKYTWILPDLPGSGNSVYNPSLPELKDFAELLHAIMLQEQIPEFVLIGHSMGGYISLAFAEKYPDQIKGLGLFHSSSYEDSRRKKRPGKKTSFSFKKTELPPLSNRQYPAYFRMNLKPKNRKKSGDWLNDTPTLQRILSYSIWKR